MTTHTEDCKYTVHREFQGYLPVLRPIQILTESYMAFT